MIFKKVFESILALALGVAIAYALLCLYAVFFGDRLLFATQPSTYAKDPEIVTVTSRLGGEIPLFYLPNKNATYTILYSHGNLEDVGFIRPRMEVFRRHGFSILCYDYPGFGIATGEKSEDGCFAAADAAYRYLTETLKVPPAKIILYGRSLGGGPTAYLAAKRRVAGVVLHSTFVSAFRVQTGIKALWWDRFENLSAVPKIRAPILFVHGLSDETIPVWHTQMMIEAAQRAGIPTMQLLVPLALHNNVIEIARDDYWGTMDKFTTFIAAYAKAGRAETIPLATEAKEKPSEATSAETVPPSPKAPTEPAKETLPAPEQLKNPPSEAQQSP